ncbi:MAG: thioredoxin domain-containing protein [Actinomycetota bacterium]
MANRLAAETSPYLRQHRDNPVEWYPWSEEAFERARERDVPVFLSVGYSACHWCHVMAHESFESDTTAALMNDRFVNVKVDREERPDVDSVYMQAVQAMTGRGGWPMSVWLTPDGRPFYGGTYYPDQERHGMPSFTTVCEAVAAAWRDRRDDVAEQAARLTGVIDEQVLRPENRAALVPETLATAYERVRAQFEPGYGGFGRAPKFPHAMTLDFLCRAYVRDASPETLEMITTSLDAMAAGGMYDQIGGGFARYSTDDYWLVPHFEKMLYDNALLTRAYLHAYLVTGEPRYRRIVEETVDYVLRDLRHPDGGFFAAEDADSEGVEGKFYLWSLAEIREIAGDDADEVVRYYGVTQAGNFVDPHTGYSGNILHVVTRNEEPPAAVQRARPQLLARRAQRVRPGLDDKVLLGWNALFLGALVEAAAALERDNWRRAARANARFLIKELRRPDRRLLRSWRAPYLAFAEDYAALLEALCTLAEYDHPSWLDFAVPVADDMIRLFHDPDRGGFFTTGRDVKQLVVRQKDAFDDATPSANSMAANGLLRLAALTGREDYAVPARAVLGMLTPLITTHPTAFSHALAGVERHVSAPLELAIIGPRDDERTHALRRVVTERLVPNAVMLVTDPATAASSRLPLLEGRTMVGGAPAAYVCEGYACRHPVTTASELRAQLDDAFGERQRAAT